MPTFNEKLRRAIERSGSTLCVGLDPHLNLIPASLNESIPDEKERVISFLTKVIELTHPYCAAYKPNLAFYEALGEDGLKIFSRVLQQIPGDKIIVADAKRGDIGSTAANYRKAFFDHWDVDAITLNPLMGFETLSSYYEYPGKAIYALTLTSNPGADDFLTQPFSGFNTMAEFIASNLSKLQLQSDAALGLVVGATQPDMLTSVLAQHTSAPLLIPGIGTQGGKIEELITALEHHEGLPLISSSRSILFAGGDSPDWEDAVLEKVKSYQEQLSPITEQYV